MNARQLDWTSLSYFLETASSGTLAAAAARLGVNSSTVHRRLAALEEQLGARLFDRSQQGYALTDAGEQLLDHVKAMEREVFAIERKVAGQDTSLSGTIRVATVDDMASEILPAILSKLRREHPELTVEVMVESAIVDLRRSQADVALRFGGRPSDPDIVAKRIARVGVGVFASREYIERRGAPATAAELVNHDLVRGTESMSGVPMEKFFREFATETNTSFRSNSMVARVHAVAAGLGIGPLSMFAIGQVDNLVQLDLETPDLSAYCWLVLHPDVRGNARVRAFMDFVGDRLMELEPRLWKGEHLRA